MGALASMEEIHFFRPNSAKVISKTNTTQLIANIIITSDLDTQIHSLMEMSDFRGINGLLKIIKNKDNYNLLSIEILNRILVYLQTLWSTPSNFIELRNKTDAIIQAKRKIHGVK